MNATHHCMTQSQRLPDAIVSEAVYHRPLSAKNELVAPSIYFFPSHCSLSFPRSRVLCLPTSGHQFFQRALPPVDVRMV